MSSALHRVATAVARLQLTSGLDDHSHLSGQCSAVISIYHVEVLACQPKPNDGCISRSCSMKHDSGHHHGSAQSSPTAALCTAAAAAAIWQNSSSTEPPERSASPIKVAVRAKSAQRESTKSSTAQNRHSWKSKGHACSASGQPLTNEVRGFPCLIQSQAQTQLSMQWWGSAECGCRRVVMRSQPWCRNEESTQRYNLCAG